MGSLYLHIGLPKTATTFQQKKVIPNIPDTLIINKDKGEYAPKNIVGGSRSIVTKFFKRSPFIWEDLGDKIFKDIVDMKKKYIKDDVLISDELMYRHLLASDRLKGKTLWHVKGMVYPRLYGIHIDEIDKKSKEWGFEGVKIIISIRSQEKWIASYYSQISNRIKNASQKNFEDFVNYIVDYKRGYYYEGISINYNILYDVVCDAIGKNNVLMIPYETFKHRPESFVNEWFNFMGKDMPKAENIIENTKRKYRKRSIDKNTYKISKSSFDVYKKFRLHENWYLDTLFGKITFPKYITLDPKYYTERLFGWSWSRDNYIRINKDIKSKIKNRFSKSNKVLNSKIEYNLDKYNYI